MAADARSNAGVDHIAMVRKLALFEEPGECVMALLAAGNLAATQAVVTLLQQRLGGQGAEDLYAATTMFEAARMVGAVLREVLAYDGEHVQPHGAPSATFLFAGQPAGERHRLFLIYPAGNFIEATAENALPAGRRGQVRQVDPGSGDQRQGEPPCRGQTHAAVVRRDDAQPSLGDAADRPLCYREGSLGVELRAEIQASDPCFTSLRAQYSQGMLALFDRLPAPSWVAGGDAPDD